MCLEKYTCLPRLWGEWEDDLSDVMPAFLPAAGLVAGLLWWALAALARWLLPGMPGAALTALFPFALTGLVHLKGYWNASASLLGRGRLKDAPAGFASAVMLALLALLQFSACASVRRIFPLALIPVLSRACCALHMLKQANAAADEDHAFPASLLNIEKCIAVVPLALMLVFSGPSGLFSGAAVLGGYALCSRVLVKDAENSADACGFAVTVAELCGLIVLAVL